MFFSCNFRNFTVKLATAAENLQNLRGHFPQCPISSDATALIWSQRHRIVAVLTPPVSVASNERNSSRLDLRSCMTEDRLSDLGLLSMKRERTKDSDKNAIVLEFANTKAGMRAF